jgi:hypothetical protein
MITLQCTTSDQYAFFFATCNSKASELMWHIIVGTMAEIIIIWSGPTAQ